MLLIVSIMWSFVGILVKIATQMTDSFTITFFRFFFGVVFLCLFMFIRGKKIKLHWMSKWIWFGALGKCCNYIFENLGISLGHAYGNILVMPIQAIFLVLVSALFFKEKIIARSWIAAVLCIIGIFLVSWNGIPLALLFSSNALITLLFVFSAIGAGIHLLSQKILIETMESADMNLSVFFLSSLMTVAPLPITFRYHGTFLLSSCLALIILGLITGISFYLYANALKKVPFLAAIILSNSSILFTLLWTWLFLREPITQYVVIGATLFIIGVILLNLPKNFFRNRTKFI